MGRSSSISHGRSFSTGAPATRTSSRPGGTYTVPATSCGTPGWRQIRLAAADTDAGGGGEENPEQKAGSQGRRAFGQQTLYQSCEVEHSWVEGGSTSWKQECGHGCHGKWHLTAVTRKWRTGPEWKRRGGHGTWLQQNQQAPEQKDWNPPHAHVQSHTHVQLHTDLPHTHIHTHTHTHTRTPEPGPYFQRVTLWSMDQPQVHYCRQESVSHGMCPASYNHRARAAGKEHLLPNTTHRTLLSILKHADLSGGESGQTFGKNHPELQRTLYL